MNENASKLVAELMVKATKKAGLLLGPGFLNLVGHHASALMAKKIGDNPPDGLDLDQSLDYVCKNLSKFVAGCSVYVYAVAKAESTLQGATGSITRMVAKTGSISYFDTVLKNKIPAHADNTADGLNKYYYSLVKSGLMKQEDLRIVSATEDCVRYKVNNCPYAEGCKPLLEEGVPKILGGHECWRSLFFATAIESLTEKPHDYKDLEINPPNCSATIFCIEKLSKED